MISTGTWSQSNVGTCGEAQAGTARTTPTETGASVDMHCSNIAMWVKQRVNHMPTLSQPQLDRGLSWLEVVKTSCDHEMDIIIFPATFGTFIANFVVAS